MCGFLFLDQSTPGAVASAAFQRALDHQQWRGPDAQHVARLADDRVLIGHHRLSIVDPVARADQPMVSLNGRYVIAYNGEIYNHEAVRRQLSAAFQTHCDTETILEGYAELGERIFDLIDGMFALVIYDQHSGDWIAARDRFGIKPLFIQRDGHGQTILGSEAAGVAALAGAAPCPQALDEWRLIRRPLPGKSFFAGVDEVLPGTIVRRDGSVHTYWRLQPSAEPYTQARFDALLADAVRAHEMSDVRNVALLSGGLDSAVITALSQVTRCYCVGLPDNNEFVGAADSARLLQRELVNITVSAAQMQQAWADLARLRGEPLGVPNEGLIYLVCKHMQPDEKVVLTGEGADELLFGYDGIYRWASTATWQGAADFLLRYGYADTVAPTARLAAYVEALHEGKTTLAFVEDFFYAVHLPGLLRRMDFASMAASKEARVPFVSTALAEYMYRRPYASKISAQASKLPLRVLAASLGLHGALDRKKIGFSAQLDASASRYAEYAQFQSIVLGALQWS